MGKCGVKFKRVMFEIEDELTQVYVLVEAMGDCPIGLQGWHHKTFPPNKSVLEIMSDWQGGDEDPLSWPLAAPLKT